MSCRGRLTGLPIAVRGTRPTGSIRPPQQGQRSTAAVEHSGRSPVGTRAGSSSSLRQRASLAARWPLARKP